ncbi:MAG: hypothetical protein ACI9XO_003590 [Paraglaciecola sp.]|jgi:hypothetical protein
MTLSEFFDLIGNNPILIVSYFLLIPFTSILAGILGKGEGHITPWKYLYSILIYLVAVPGIFAITLNIYLFAFERQSVFDMNIFTQLLPVVSMVGTLLLIRRNVPLDYVPGVDKLGGLVSVIGGTLTIMWFIDKTRLYIFSYMKFEYVILIIIGLIVMIRFGWKKAIGGGAER